MPSKPQLNHLSCVAARKVGEHCSHRFGKKNQRTKSVRRPRKACGFARVQASGRAGLRWQEHYTRVLSMGSTQLTPVLHFAVAKPAPHIFAVQNRGLCPFPGLRRSNAAWCVVPAPSSPCSRTEERGCRDALQFYPLFIGGTFPSSGFALWAKPPPLLQAVKQQPAVSISSVTQKTKFTQILGLYLFIKQTSKKEWCSSPWIIIIFSYFFKSQLFRLTERCSKAVFLKCC